MNRRTLIVGVLLIVLAGFAVLMIWINNGGNAMREMDSRNGTGTYLQGQASYNMTRTREAELTPSLEVTDTAAQTETSP